MKKIQRTGGELVVDTLCELGSENIFCVPGESYLEVLNALYDVPNTIRVISCRHEQGASNMAEAYGKLTGKPGICMVTRGPGACNAAIGVHTAFQDSTPMILFIGQVNSHYLGREAFQEIDYEKMFNPIAKVVEQISKVDDIVDAIARAHNIALSGRQGPVVLSIPEDILRDRYKSISVVNKITKNSPPSVGEMKKLEQLLKQSKKPVMMLGGSGWSLESRLKITSFAESFNLPVCCSFRRHDLFDNNHKNFVGEMGISPNPELVSLVKYSDFFLVVGARLGEVTSQNYTLLGKKKQKLIHVYPEKSELGKVYTSDIAIHSTVDNFARAISQFAPFDPGCWNTHTKKARENYLAGRKPRFYRGLLDLGQVMAEIDNILGVDGVICVDAGNFSGWPQRFIPIGGKRRFLGPTSGAMGYGIPAAITAKTLFPDRVVIGCVGDGCFGMTGQEISTAVKEGANIIVVVFSNSMLGTIRYQQERRFPNRVIATEIRNPDYALVAKASGAFGETIKRTEQFGPALERAITSNLPAVLDLQMDPDLISTRENLKDL